MPLPPTDVPPSASAPARILAGVRGAVRASPGRETLSRNVDAEFRVRRTFAERVSDRIAEIGGSWTFVIAFLLVLVGWVVLNAVVLGPGRGAFDPYPFILLNLVLSTIAALQAPVIMMSQNRQAARDRLAAQHDYEVNLKAEVEIRALHDKLDALREAQWAELVRMQQDQLRILTAVLSALPAAQGQGTADAAERDPGA